jgi:hypothetical protein
VQPDDLELGSDGTFLATQWKQSSFTENVPPSGMGICFVHVAATQVPGWSSSGPARLQVCPGAVQGLSRDGSGATSARARVAPRTSVATTTATGAR